MRLNAKTNHVLAGVYLCFVNGVDVTNRCYEADEEGGWADCYVVGDDGRSPKYFPELKGPMIERLVGKVEFVIRNGVLDARA